VPLPTGDLQWKLRLCWFEQKETKEAKTEDWGSGSAGLARELRLLVCFPTELHRHIFKILSLHAATAIKAENLSV
jgi:hypothetical protein